MSNVFLFDLDGTLCRSRKKIDKDIIETLCEANKCGEVGILTGSDLDFLKEQCEDLFASLPYSNKVFALACNGTKSFEVHCSDNVEYSKIEEASIVNFLGKNNLNEVIKELIFMQADLITKYDIPLTGSFIGNRGSTINWCPIGRMADDSQRSAFVELDESLKIRKEQIKLLKGFVEECALNLEINIAGDTSIDIYPKGWDKTYAMKFFENKKVFFWGDRMFPDGNDYTMHLLLKERSFPIKSPQETKDSLTELLRTLSR